MVIFHSYVKLPEGNPKIQLRQNGPSFFDIWTAGTYWNHRWMGAFPSRLTAVTAFQVATLPKEESSGDKKRKMPPVPDPVSSGGDLPENDH